jgi:hypothetical protein
MVHRRACAALQQCRCNTDGGLRRGARGAHVRSRGRKCRPAALQAGHGYHATGERARDVRERLWRRGVRGAACRVRVGDCASGNAFLGLSESASLSASLSATGSLTQCQPECLPLAASVRESSQ